MVTCLQMEENQGCQPSEPGLKEILERLQHLQEGWSQAEEQVWLGSLHRTHARLLTAHGLSKSLPMPGSECSRCAVHLTESTVELWCAIVQLLQLVRSLHEDASRQGQALEADSLAEILVQKGHTVTVRTALGGGGGCECLRNLRHVFLSVRIQVREQALLSSRLVFPVGGLLRELLVHYRDLKIKLRPLSSVNL